MWDQGLIYWSFEQLKYYSTCRSLKFCVMLEAMVIRSLEVHFDIKQTSSEKLKVRTTQYIIIIIAVVQFNPWFNFHFYMMYDNE